MKFKFIIFVCFLFQTHLYADVSAFRITPYLQNPTNDGMTILWYTDTKEAGTLVLKKGSLLVDKFISHPEIQPDLQYSATDLKYLSPAPSLPYQHRVTLSGLESGQNYTYQVLQSESSFQGEFHTVSDSPKNLRFTVFADSETEPESTGKKTYWPDPENPGVYRSYLIDQTRGLANNLLVIGNRKPDLLFIAGDLVESGGEQRDWDEFWKQFQKIGHHIPILGALGNHDYYRGPPYSGGFSPENSEAAVAKYLNYFVYPNNFAQNAELEKRYYRVDYGPVTFIVLDTVNGGPQGSDYDTNLILLGEEDPGGGPAPSLTPNSEQYLWLEAELKNAQITSQFTFLIFHHAPYSSGPHGFEPENHSGIPLRKLTPLFMKYGVDAVFSGHDETWERSRVEGTEQTPAGNEIPHSIHFYDLGVAGDGIRGAHSQAHNAFQRFFVHTDVPEVWENGILVAGGKHYGHLEINVQQNSEGNWEAELLPVYIFPIFDSETGTYSRFERRIYPDTIKIVSTQ